MMVCRIRLIRAALAAALPCLLLAGCGESGDIEGPSPAAPAFPAPTVPASASLVATPLPASALVPSFRRVRVDGEMAGDCKAIGDFDADGHTDLVVAGMTLEWYRGPDWRKTTIAEAEEEFTTDCQAVDLDGDGRLDIVTADGKDRNNVVWFRNPGTGGAWSRHAIGTHGNWTHDIEVSDFDGDGKADVLTHGNGTHLWFQDGGGRWTDRELSAMAKTKEGVGIGDIDGDGRVDIVQGGWWFANPGGRDREWSAYRFAEGHDGGSFSAAVGDIDGDGRPDIALAEQHKRHEFAWYRAPADARAGAWTKHAIDGDIGAHKLQLADLNGDGRLDFAVGLELAELRVYVNRGGTAPSFARRTLNRSGCHNARTGDVDGDGDIDILCANYIKHPPVELWLNEPAPPLALDRWRHVLVDAARARLASGHPAFGLAFGDIDGDARTDIVSGRHFYRNPGGDLSGVWRRSDFPVDTDAMLVLDVDDDGRPDVIAQALPEVHWLEPDADGSQWQAHSVARLPATEHGNGQGYRLARIVAGSRKPEVVFTTGDGVWVLRVPDNPAAGPWPSMQIASGTSEDLLATGDIDGDGLDDIVVSDRSDGKTIRWYRNPGQGGGNWARYALGEAGPWADRAELADIDGDGRLDAVIAVENGKAEGASAYWFEAPQDPREPWTRHLIATQGSINSMSVGNLDGRGGLEVVTGEHRGALSVRVWSSADGGASWGASTVDQGRESHLGTRLVDLDGDGALDIVSIAWDRFQELHVWRNEALAP